MDKELKKRVIDYVENNAVSDKDDLIELVIDDMRERGQIPKIEELEKRFVANDVAQKVATIRDARSHRLVLAKRGIKTQYVYVKKCYDVKTLNTMTSQAVRDIIGRQANVQSLKCQTQVAQVTITEYLVTRDKKAE